MRVYALLVGINDYAKSVGALRGAVNDANNYRDFLTDTFKSNQMDLQCLTNSEATRENIIHAFRDLLGRAGKDDVVLFQFAGHGARWKSAPEFQKFIPDGFDEGVICYDSRRTKTSWDLADKELALLLHEVGKNDPHIAVILDCCHSGSGTRSADDVMRLKPRGSHTIQEPRPLDSYLDKYYSNQLAKGQSLVPPSSRHMAMAGCSRYGLAYESPDEHRGVFSTTLLAAIERTGLNVSYADLFLRVRSLVRKVTFGQDPQFEAYQGFNAYNGFLNRMEATRSKRFSVHYVDWDSWYVNCGAINGVPDQMDTALELQLFADETSEEALGTAVSTSVGLNETKLDIKDFKPSKKSVYSAEITSVPNPLLDVYLSGEQAGVDALLDTTENSEVVAASFAWEQESPARLKYSVLADRDGFQVGFLETGKLIQKVKGIGTPSCEHVVNLLNRIVNWEHTLHLQNSAAGVDTSGVDFIFAEDQGQGKPLIDHVAEEVTFDIVKRNGKWSEVSGQILGQNKTDQRLHLMLVWFDEQFGVNVLYNEPQDKNDERFVFQLNVAGGSYEEMGFCLEDHEGNQASHTLKLFVSKDKIDDFLLDQRPIEMGATVDPTEPHQSRGGKFKKKIQEVSWFTKQIKINLVRNVADVGKSEAELASGQIRVKAHPALTGGASLLPASQVSRGNNDSFAQGLAKYGFDLVNFSTARGEDQSVLEISNIDHRESIEESPLELEVDIDLADDEYILPLVFDGEHMMLAGDAWKDDDGKTQVAINRIPEDRSGSRSAFSAFRLYFFKAVCGFDHVNKLVQYSIEEDGSIKRTTSGLGERINAAERILLLVHGLFGNSTNIAKQVCGVIANGDPESSLPFDLILGYNYESINTPIEDTARELASLLKTKGIDENTDKQITILAHSMGGLVSRWLIEQEGGNSFVDHLIMCGTPNEGSPFGSVAVVARSMNNLANIAINLIPPFAKGYIQGVQKTLADRSLSTTLSQMAANSDFMQSINTSDDPGVQYTILAGNIGDYVQNSDDEHCKTLLVKIGATDSFHMMFGNEPHDVAVSVDSMRAVLDSRSPPPSKTNLSCHHLNYLLGEQGQQTFRQVDWAKESKV